MKRIVNRPPPVQQPPTSVTLTLSWEDFSTLVEMTGLSPIEYLHPGKARDWQTSNWHVMRRTLLDNN